VKEVTPELAIDRGAVSSQSDREHPDRLADLTPVENLPPLIEGEVLTARCLGISPCLPGAKEL